MNKYESLVNIIKDLRNQCNLSTKEVAENLGITQPSYTYKENLKNNFDMIEILKLKDMFDFNIKISYIENDQIQEVLNDYESIVNTISMLRVKKGITKDNFRFILNMSLPNYLNKENLKSKKPFYMDEIIKIFKELDINFVIEYSLNTTDKNNKKVKRSKKLKLC